MDRKSMDDKVDINFESHPPIEGDLNGISALLKQTFLDFVECHELARYLIHLKDQTQVIAQEEPEEENTSEEDEPDEDIYGVCSVVELPLAEKVQKDGQFLRCRKQLLKWLREKFPKFDEMIKTMVGDNIKVGVVINERYINLPPQLSLPTLKTLTESLDVCNYTHLVFVSKVLMKSRDSETKLPSKKCKSGLSSSLDSEPLIFVNAEEEIICENAEYFADIDVSTHCDENTTWSTTSDIRYIPHRRLMLLDYKNWPKTIQNLEKEL